MSKIRPRKDRPTYAFNRKTFFFFGFIAPIIVILLVATIAPLLNIYFSSEGAWRGFCILVGWFFMIPSAGCRSVDIGKSEPFGLLTIIPVVGFFVSLYLLFKKGIYRGLGPLFSVPPHLENIGFPPPPQPQGLRPPLTCSWCGESLSRFNHPGRYMGVDKLGNHTWFCKRCIDRILTNKFREGMEE